MEDLISRKKVVKIIKPRLNSANDGTLEHQRLYSILATVEELPAAYDADKVVAKLEEHRKSIMEREGRDILNVVGKANAKAAIEKAIEIVKSGCIG